jgi:hypothetical protein
VNKPVKKHILSIVLIVFVIVGTAVACQQTDNNGDLLSLPESTPSFARPDTPAPEVTLTPEPDEVTGRFDAIEAQLTRIDVRLSAMISRNGILPDSEVKEFLDFIGEVSDYLNNDYWVDLNNYEDLPEHRLISFRFGEGGIGYGLNYTAIRTALYGRLSEAYTVFLELREQYNSQYLIDDMALRMSWDEWAQMIIDWSSFQRNYPDFVENISVTFYVWIYVGCFNLDNTPVIWHITLEQSILEQSVKASYERFLSNPESKIVAYYDDIEALYKIWEASNFEYTQSVRDFIDALEAKLYPDF